VRLFGSIRDLLSESHHQIVSESSPFPVGPSEGSKEQSNDAEVEEETQVPQAVGHHVASKSGGSG
jgi:hypothetical protein